MSTKLLHSPEGVRDIYGSELLQKKDLEHALSDVIHSYGFAPVSTPSFEYFDVFAGGLTTIASRNLFKFFDREGNTLVLRPDITPSIARAAAMYFAKDPKPLRLYYKGNIFINHSRYQGRLAESTQMGAECIGDDSVDADAQMIALSIDCLLRSGLKRFSVSIGHAAILKELCELCRFSDAQTEEFQEIVYHHNALAAERFLSDRVPEGDLRSLFALVTSVYHTPADWADLRKTAEAYPGIAAALDRMAVIHEILQMYGADGYVTYEPGLVLSYEYYTGVVFAGYAAGTGQPVVTGGRYDGLLANFGMDACAIGFALAMDAMLSAVIRQEGGLSQEPQMSEILYTPAARRDAIERAMRLRAEGLSVILSAVPEDFDPDVRFPEGIPAHTLFLNGTEEKGGLL